MFEDFCLRCGFASANPSGYCSERCYQQDRSAPSYFASWDPATSHPHSHYVDTHTAAKNPDHRSSGIEAWAAEIPLGCSPEQPTLELPPRPQSRSTAQNKPPLPKPRLIHRQTSVSPTISMSMPRTAPISTSAPVRTPQQNIAESLSQYSRSVAGSGSSYTLISPILSYSTNPSTTSASPATSLASVKKHRTRSPLQSSFPSIAPPSPLFREKIRAHPDPFVSPKARDFTFLAMTHRQHPVFPNDSSDHESALGSSYLPSSILERKLSPHSPHQTPRQRLVHGHRQS